MAQAYKRAVVVGCSHGAHVCPGAQESLVKFIKDYKPHRVIHLGDFCDTAAFRTGARDGADGAEPVAPDITTGLRFLEEIGATDVLMGNHEDRLWNLAKHPNAIVSYASRTAIDCIEDACKRMKAKAYLWDGVFQYAQLGNYKLLHGTMYGENAIRDHAEAHGNVIHAHTHRPGVATGRRDDHPIGMCVGSLARRRDMAYAKSRRATLSWGMGFVWGEYNDKTFHPNLCLGPQEGDGGNWRLP